MKRYLCRRAAGDAAADALTADWFAACEALSFRENTRGGAPREATDLKLCYTEQALYAYFAVEDAAIVAGYDRYNQPLYEEDAVELFLSPTGDKRQYLELEFNPNGAVFCGAIQNDCGGRFRLFLAPESAAACASRKTQRGWDCFVRIPMSEFVLNVPPKGGDTWLFNGYRVEKDAAGGITLYAACPTLCETFHTPSAFFELVFS